MNPTLTGRSKSILNPTLTDPFRSLVLADKFFPKPRDANLKDTINYKYPKPVII
jgi:hypothetical protein